ncbi:subtilisin-like protein [Tothia fuscella]|uniref:tripeptidyl-peptidase II n=1 Tax=Tothia fuscella TaxID=1048955 RepID=A0A9P4U3Q3_9PEZI|nr:subtilisin-like protein [Tothia fuscella]
MIPIAWLLTTCLSIVAVIASNRQHTVHERRATTTSIWTKRSFMNKEATLPIRIALTQRNLETAEGLIRSVSDPASPQYAQYWTPQAVAQQFAPSQATVDEVADWLNTSGISHTRLRRSHSGTELYFHASVDEVETLLGTKYHVYENKHTGEIVGGCDEYSVPGAVREHIDFITPTVHHDHRLELRNSKRLEQSPSPHLLPRDLNILGGANASFPGCDQLITPECLRSLYHIPIDNTTHPNNSFGIIQITPTSYLPEDLDLFFQQFGPTMVGNRPKLESIDGGFLQDFVKIFNFNSEPDLDLEYAMSLTSPMNITNYQVGDMWHIGNMNHFLAAVDQAYCGALDPTFDPVYPDATPAVSPFPGGYNSSDCGTHRPTKVISVSYTHDEIEYTPAYARRQCHEYLKLGLQGITVVFASGDSGTAGNRGQCLDPTTGQPSNNTNVRGIYNPSFPSTCPWVTSVGGTQLPPNASVSDIEVAFDIVITNTFNGSTTRALLSSGGGFSNLFSTPWYQASNVKSYLDREYVQLRDKNSLFHSSGSSRGYPDVAANAWAHVTAVDGTFRKVYGTSAAAPVFASIIAKINDMRLSMGKAPVGFINPVMYANPEVLNDIVNGTNYGCADEKAFPVGQGWDPVTGLGTPDFVKMKELYLRLP